MGEPITPPTSPTIGRESHLIYNELYRRWAEEYGVDPAEDPEFLRAWRFATGHDPQTGLLETTRVSNPVPSPRVLASSAQLQQSFKLCR